MELTDKQESFVHYLVNGACSATEAAKRAGYEGSSIRQSASQLLRKPHVQEAIRQEQFRRLNGHLANLALSTLEGVMADPEAPHGAKVQAAIAVLERSGIHHNIEANKISASHAPINQASIEKLQEFAREGMARIEELKAKRAQKLTQQ